MTDQAITVVVVDDHPVFRLGMVGLLSSLPGIEVSGQAANRVELERAIASPPRVVMMDLQLHGAADAVDESGIELTRWLSHTHPEIAVLVITMSDDDTSVAAAVRAGARGYLLKAAAPEEVERAVRAVANGEMILGAQVAARAMAQVVGGRAAVRVPFPELHPSGARGAGPGSPWLGQRHHFAPAGAESEDGPQSRRERAHQALAARPRGCDHRGARSRSGVLIGPDRRRVRFCESRSTRPGSGCGQLLSTSRMTDRTWCRGCPMLCSAWCRASVTSWATCSLASR